MRLRLRATMYPLHWASASANVRGRVRLRRLFVAMVMVVVFTERLEWAQWQRSHPIDHVHQSVPHRPVAPGTHSAKLYAQHQHITQLVATHPCCEGSLLSTAFRGVRGPSRYRRRVCAPSSDWVEEDRPD